MRTITALATILFSFATAQAQSWSDLATAAATQCRTDAADLRSVAADCRAHSEPPPEGGEYCTGVIRRELAPDGSIQEYVLSPADAEALADRFDEHAPSLDAGAADLVALEEAAFETRQKILELGFDKRNEDYEEWLELAQSSRDAFVRQTRNLLIGRAFAGAEELAEGIAALSRGRAQKMADRLARYGEPGIEVGKRLKRIARIKGRRAKAEEAARAIEQLQELYDESREDEDDGELAELAGALAEAVRVDGFGFLIEEIQWATAAVYAAAAGGVAEEQIDRLTTMQENDLRALKSLTELLERQIARTHARGNELRRCAYAQPLV